MIRQETPWKSGMTPGNSRVRRFPLNARGRDFAVGDIHGHFSRLDAALAAVRFAPDRDRLFSVGDWWTAGRNRAMSWRGWIAPGFMPSAAITI